VTDHIVDNGVRLAGEVFVPGASQFLNGNIGSGLAHNLLAGAAGLGLVASGVAPIIGTVAILAVRLNSFSTAVTGRNFWDGGVEALVDRQRREPHEPASARSARSSGSTTATT
jgi:hypothetical protein